MTSSSKRIHVGWNWLPGGMGALSISDHRGKGIVCLANWRRYGGQICFISTYTVVTLKSTCGSTMDGAQNFLKPYQMRLKSEGGEEWDVQGPAIMRWRETLQWKLGVTTQSETKRKVWQKGNGSIAPVRAKEWSYQPGPLNHRSNQPQISLPKTIKGGKGHQPKDQKN